MLGILSPMLLSVLNKLQAALSGEVQDILFTRDGGAVSNIYGQMIYTYDVEDPLTLDWTSGMPTSEALQTALEDVYGVGNVTVEAAPSGVGYRLSLGAANLDEAAITFNATYPSDTLNDAGGTQPAIDTNRTYTAGVSAVKEIYTVTIPTDETRTGNFGNGSLTGSVTYGNDGVIDSQTAPTGFTNSGGGPGAGSSTFTQDTPGAIADFSLTSGPGSVNTGTQGVTPVDGVVEIYTFNCGSGTGTVNFSPDGTLAATSGTIDSVTPPTGYTVTSGGVATSSVTFTKDTAGSVSDLVVTLDETSSSNYGVTQQGVDAISGVAEVFTYTTGGNITGSGTYNLGDTKNITWEAGLIVSYDTPSGFTVIAGGTASTSVQFEQDLGVAIGDATVTGGGISILVNQQGVTAVEEVLGRVIITWTGAAGWITYADAFTPVVIPVNATDEEALAILDDVGAYDTAITDVTMTSTSMTIDFAATEQSTSVALTGSKTGNLVTAAITTVQDGA